jgi:hypothetical protein
LSLGGQSVHNKGCLALGGSPPKRKIYCRENIPDIVAIYH